MYGLTPMNGIIDATDLLLQTKSNTNKITLNTQNIHHILNNRYRQQAVSRKAQLSPTAGVPADKQAVGGRVLKALKATPLPVQNALALEGNPRAHAFECRRMSPPVGAHQMRTTEATDARHATRIQTRLPAKMHFLFFLFRLLQLTEDNQILRRGREEPTSWLI